MGTSILSTEELLMARLTWRYHDRSSCPGRAVARFEGGGSSICQPGRACIFRIHGLTETSLFTCGMSTPWMPPTLTTMQRGGIQSEEATWESAHQHLRSVSLFKLEQAAMH